MPADAASGEMGIYTHSAKRTTMVRGEGSVTHLGEFLGRLPAEAVAEFEHLGARRRFPAHSGPAQPAISQVVASTATAQALYR